MVKDLKYLIGYSIPAAAIIGIFYPTWFAYLTPIYAFGFLPLIELFTKPDPANLSEEEEQRKHNSPFYDFMLYLSVPIQYTVIFLLVSKINQGSQSLFEVIGMVLSAGISCGAIGINVAHELGHRVTKHERIMAKALLLTSLYMHFYIEHNRGHHKYVSTPQDPATARYGESLYRFIIRSVLQSVISAWNIEKQRLTKKNIPILSFSNEMLRFALIEIIFVLIIFIVFGLQSMLAFVAAAVIGFVLLETINYIEHYGLMRKEIAPGKYEIVRPEHSWNSDYRIGRIMLFELTRHSDHHYKASRKYQVLRHFGNAPQLPTGYPGMMLLATIPPLWFKTMNQRIKDLQLNYQA
ncbi:MAG: alkane 1-monooxygenase [Flavobacteriales bacterium]